MQALFHVISRVGIPMEILTDQGNNFMSRTIRELYGLLKVKAIRTSVYHPATDGLCERFNQTLKSIIRKFVHKDARNWHQWLDVDYEVVPMCGRTGAKTNRHVTSTSLQGGTMWPLSRSRRR